MAVGSAILPARDVDPEVLAVGGLEDELIKVSIVLNPVEPFAGSFQIGMTLVVVPGGIAG